MNSVHEPSPNGDSETLPSQKPRSKTQTGCMSPQLAQPAHQARARVRVVASPAPYRGRAARPYPSLWLPCRSLMPRAPACPARTHPAPCAPACTPTPAAREPTHASARSPSALRAQRLASPAPCAPNAQRPRLPSS